MVLGIGATVLLLILSLVGLLLVLAAQSRAMTVSLGVSKDRLSACPTTPNCVSSDASRADAHYIAPIADPSGSRWAALLERVGAMDGARLIESTDAYARFEFRSKLLGFIDDVEFHRRPETQQIAVRSASRVGRGDMNANRKRVEAIRTLL